MTWFGINNTVQSWIQSYLSSILHCKYQQHQIFSFSASIWCSSRFCPWSSSFHALHNSLSHIISRSSVDHKLYMLMTLSSSLLSLYATSNKTFNSYKTPFLNSLPGWLPTSFLSTPLKLNFYSLFFLRTSLKLIILLYLCFQALSSNLLLLLEILVLYST